MGAVAARGRRFRRRRPTARRQPPGGDRKGSLRAEAGEPRAGCRQGRPPGSAGGRGGIHRLLLRARQQRHGVLLSNPRGVRPPHRIASRRARGQPADRPLQHPRSDRWRGYPERHRLRQLRPLWQPAAGDRAPRRADGRRRDRLQRQGRGGHHLRPPHGGRHGGGSADLRRLRRRPDRAGRVFRQHHRGDAGRDEPGSRAKRPPGGRRCRRRVSRLRTRRLPEGRRRLSRRPGDCQKRPRRHRHAAPSQLSPTAGGGGGGRRPAGCR